MGLLDFLNSSGGGGLLSFLNNQQQFPVGLPSDTAQYGSPMGAMAQAPQAQPQQPMQQLGQPMQVSQQGLPPALGGGSSFGHLFAPDSFMGRLTGNDSRTVAQQNLKAQYDSLVPVLGPQKALLAVMNPEAGKTLLTEALTNKEKWGVVSKDPLEGEKYGFINERDQTVNGQPLGQGGSVPGQATGLQSILDKINTMKAQGATKQQLIAALPNGYREDVDALVSGKAVPANMGRAALRGPLNIMAHAVDGEYDETQLPGRIQMRKDFMGEGKNGQAIGAFNTVQHHAGQVSDAIDEFEKAGGGGNWPLLNAGKLMIADNTSFDPKLRNAAEKLKNKLNATEHEVAAAYNAGHITDADRKTWNDIKASNLPADQLREKLADFVELLNGKRDSLNHIYRTTFHEDAPTLDKAANDEVTQRVLSRRPGAQQAAPAGATTGIPSGWKVNVR